MHKAISSLLSCYAVPNNVFPSRKIELIIIDDGSLDNSLEEANIIQKKYDNSDKEYASLIVKVISQSNSGVSATRNRGIDLAKGEYIWFVDSDDIIHPDALEYILDVIDTKRPDLFHFPLKYSAPIDDINQYRFDEIIKNNVKPGNYIDFLVRIRITSGPVQYCTRKSIIQENNIRFNENIHFYEDRLFILDVALLCSDILYTDNILYYYIQNPGSALNNKTLDHLKRYTENILLLLPEYQRFEKPFEVSKMLSLYIRKEIGFMTYRHFVGKIKYSDNWSEIKQSIEYLKGIGLYPMKKLPWKWGKMYRHHYILWIICKYSWGLKALWFAKNIKSKIIKDNHK